VLSTFHYALRPTGFLVLGPSETLGSSSDLFGVFDNKKLHFYFRKTTPSRLLYPGFISVNRREGLDEGKDVAFGPSELQKKADQVVLERFGPPGVVITPDLKIIQFRGLTGPYLEPSAGEATLDLPKMLRDGLVADTRALVAKALETDAPVR